MSRLDKNHIDEWLKEEIKKGIAICNEVLNNGVREWELYYTGHLSNDILNNFPGRTSKKIFKGYREVLNNNHLVFIQKKIEPGGFEYFVRKAIK
tara:strand:- start:1037 stop:1318 length:282 start_codon:yes stop_codon:yes gene_type:complete